MHSNLSPAAFSGRFRIAAFRSIVLSAVRPRKETIRKACKKRYTVEGKSFLSGERHATLFKGEVTISTSSYLPRIFFCFIYFIDSSGDRFDVDGSINFFLPVRICLGYVYRT